jgi:hypothetical protein
MYNYKKNSFSKKINISLAISSEYLSFKWFPILFLFSDNSHTDLSKSDQRKISDTSG